MSLHEYSHSWLEEDAKEAPKESPKTHDDDDGWGLRKDVSAMAGTPRAARGAPNIILPEADELVSNILSKSDAALSIQRVLRGHVGRKRALRLTGRQKMTTKKIEGKDKRLSDNSKNGNIPLSLFQDTPEVAALFDGNRKFSHGTIVGEPLFNEDILKAMPASVAADTLTQKQWNMKRTQSLTDLLEEGASQHESNKDIFTRSSSSPNPMIPGTCTSVCVCVCVC
jgi:hypothetical protein